MEIVRAGDVLVDIAELRFKMTSDAHAAELVPDGEDYFVDILLGNSIGEEDGSFLLNVGVPFFRGDDGSGGLWREFRG